MKSLNSFTHRVAHFRRDFPFVWEFSPDLVTLEWIYTLRDGTRIYASGLPAPRCSWYIRQKIGNSFYFVSYTRG